MVYHFKHVAIYVQQMRGNRYLNLQRIKGIQPQKKKEVKNDFFKNLLVINRNIICSKGLL